MGLILCRLTMGDISGAEVENPSGALAFFSFLCEAHLTNSSFLCSKYTSKPEQYSIFVFDRM